MLCEMQSVSCKIWTRVAVSILYDDNHYTTRFTYSFILRESPWGVVVSVLDYDTVVSKFELQSPYYIYSQINTLGKGMNLLFSPQL